MCARQRVRPTLTNSRLDKACRLNVTRILSPTSMGYEGDLRWIIEVTNYRINLSLVNLIAILEAFVSGR